MSFDGIIKSFTSKVIDPLIDASIKCHVNRADVRENLKSIIVKIEKILQQERADSYVELGYEEVKAMLAPMVEKLKQELKLHFFRKKTDRNSREQLLKILEDIDSSFQDRCNEEILKKYLKDLQRMKHRIHLLHPLPHHINESTPIKIIGFGAFVSLCVISLSAVAYEKSQVDIMKKNCMEISKYRSNEWPASFLPPYKYFLEESYMVAAKTCISAYKKEKKEYQLNLAEDIFSNLKKNNPKSIQATFFLDYIKNPSNPDYKESVELIQDYIDDQNNHILTKEDFDTAIKIAHILEGNQKFDTANKLYKIILGKDENNINALLGICTTHFTLESQEDKIKDISKKCKQSVEKLNEQKVVEKDSKRKKQAISYHNYGCLLLRSEEYAKAKEQFELGHQKDAKNDDITKATAFSMLFAGKYKDAKTLITSELKNTKNLIFSEFYKDPTEFRKDMQIGLGLAYLGLAEKAEDNKDKKSYYEKAYENIKSSNDKTINNIYLKKIADCTSNNQKECLANFPSRNTKENNSLFTYLHSKVLAFINHYQMDPNINDLLIPFPDKDDKNIKWNACTIMNKKLK
jgi:hypothetical protein